jgi:hypothetical protein
MAGLGRKVFTAGDVLTASDMQSYVMDQTVMNFAGTAARSSAIATPTTGMTTYNQTTQQLETYNGSAYIGMSGLQLVKKQTIGSGVSSVTVTGAFSAAYENYKIVITGGSASANDGIGIAMNGAGTAYYSSLIYTSYSSNTVVGFARSNVSSVIFMGYASAANGLSMNCDVEQPFLAKPTIFRGSHVQTISSGIAGTSNGTLVNTTSYTAFDIAPQTGTLTGGTIYVYGYGT